MPFIKKAYHWLIDLAETLVIAGAIFVVIYAFLVRPFQVNGDSMFPTFLNNEFVFTNLLSQRFGPLDRGDVIVFKAPPEPNKDFIKRVVGLPGETIKIEGGYVYINGLRLDESAYLAPTATTTPGGFAHEGEDINVSQNSYFVLGDNRGRSSDSREWGLVPFDKVIGKSSLVYWPINRIRLVEHAKYPN
jgi:signal peptidase I